MSAKNEPDPNTSYVKLLDGTVYCLSNPTNFHINDVKEMKPIWSMGNIYPRKEYFEFEVVTETDALENESEIVLEKSIEDLMNENKYICHICNLAVPTSYMNKHNSSAKHKTCLRIADVALERMRQHINQQIGVTRVRIQTTDTYFCEPCTAVVQNTDRPRHESSKIHAISVKHDELLRDLLTTYIDRGNVKIDPEMQERDTFGLTASAFAQLKEVTTLEDIKTYESKRYAKVVDKHSECDTIVAPAVVKLQDVVSYANIVKKHLEIEEPKETKTKDKTEPNDNASIRIASYIKNVVAVLNNNTEITLEDDGKIKVPVDNFHGFFNNNGRLQCRVCRVLVDGLAEMHELTQEHMKRVLLPIKDWIRQVDDKWSHCILCNQLIKNIEFHMGLCDHREKLKEDTIHQLGFNLVNLETTAKNEPILKPATEKHYCEICDVTISSEFTKSIIHYQMKTTYNPYELICVVCDDIVANDIKAIQKHVKAERHATKYNSILEENKLNIASKERYNCVVCDAYIIGSYELYHVNFINHKRLLENSLKENNQALPSAVSLNFEESGHFLSLCRIDVSCTVTSHFCVSCKIEIPNYEDAITKHYKEDAHIKTVNKEPLKIANIDEESTADKNYHFKITSDINELLCKVCNLKVANTKRYTTDHINSTEHKDSYNSMMRLNKIRKETETYYVCDICDIQITKCNEINHIYGKLHAKTIRNQLNLKANGLGVPVLTVKKDVSTIFCDTCNIELPNDEHLMNNNIGETHNETANKVHHESIPLKIYYHFKETIDSNILMCRTCNVKVGNTKIETKAHINSKEHEDSYNSLMQLNKVRRQNGIYLCDVCEVKISKFKEIDHVYGTQHAKQFLPDKTSSWCFKSGTASKDILHI